MVGFVASHEVTKDDFDKIVVPAISELMRRTDKLNYLFVVDTPLKNLSLASWLRDAMHRLNSLKTWHRAAIVADPAHVKSFADFFGNMVPGEFKGFPFEHFDRAVEWVSGKAKRT